MGILNEEENMQKFIVSSSKIDGEPANTIALPTVSSGEIEEINDGSDSE